MNWSEPSAEERLITEQAVLHRRALRKACRVHHLAGLCRLLDSDPWDTDWKSA